MLKISRKKQGSESIVELHGPIDENAGKSLAELNNLDDKVIVFDFLGVDYVNSLGIRSWINFLRHIQEGRDIFFENCIPDIVAQMNMMSHFKGAAEVRSFFGEYSCDNCGNEQVVRFSQFDSEQMLELIQNQSCENCSHILTLDEDEESYLQFLE